MRISSPVFMGDGTIPSLYSCDGSNVSPPLEIFEVPDNTQSLVLIMHDPDAPGGDFIHWLLWNIDSKTKTIAEGTVSENLIHGTNSFGHLNYDGPCPPSSTHHYYFNLYALDLMLDLETGSDKDDLEAAMQGHIIDQAETVGLYSR
jgi:Raf kinase inhibitor-like YbhB/YbcL family protein